MADLFVDDTPMLTIGGLGRAVLSAFTSLVELLQIDVQYAKVLPEGNFSSLELSWAWSTDSRP